MIYFWEDFCWLIPRLYFFKKMCNNWVRKAKGILLYVRQEILSRDIKELFVNQELEQFLVELNLRKTVASYLFIPPTLTAVCSR